MSYDISSLIEKVGTIFTTVRNQINQHKSSNDHDDRYAKKSSNSQIVVVGTLRYSKLTTEAKATTGELNLLIGSVFKVDATLGPIDITMVNQPNGKVMSITILVNGEGPITWPANIEWTDGVEPLLGSNWTIIKLMLIDNVWYGSSEQRN